MRWSWASVPWTGCSSVCGPRPPPGRPSLWSPGSPCRWWSARRRSAGRGTWSTNLSVGWNQHKIELKQVSTRSILSWTHPGLLHLRPASSHLHPGRLLPSSDGVVLEGELVLPDDGSAVFVSDVRHHVHVGRPHLKLSLPVDDGGKWGADQERPLGVTLRGRQEVRSTCPTDHISSLTCNWKFLHGTYYAIKTVQVSITVTRRITLNWILLWVSSCSWLKPARHPNYDPRRFKSHFFLIRNDVKLN